MLLFLNIGTSELFFVVVLYLVFFGSKNIPDVARFLGRTSRQIKDAKNEITKEFTAAAHDVKKEVEEHKKTLDQFDID